MRLSMKSFCYHVVCCAFLMFSALAVCTVVVRADDKSVDKDVTVDVTPDEPSDSDLKLVLRSAKLDSNRWIQSYTQDNNYYYFLQITNPYRGHLRVTRMRKEGLGQGKKDHMDLKYFGHGTNIDCSVYKGTTYLWTGSNCPSKSDVSRAISCFNYRAGSKLSHHGKKYYRIPRGKNGKYVTNVYPAVNESGNKLAVRFTMNGAQYFQVYNLTGGTKINTKKPIRQAAVQKTAGDFQGFDLYGSKMIYTIEGSPNAAFLAKYDKTRVFQPTIIRGWDLANKAQVMARTIYGAGALAFREPEGIEVMKGRQFQIMIVSFRLTDQRVNLYKVK